MCEIGLLAITARRWRSGSGLSMHVAGAVALPILFVKRRGPHNWYLALTTETTSVAAIALASAWMTCMSPSCSSSSARSVRELVTTATLAAPLGGWEVILAPSFAWLVQNAFLSRAGREADWSIRHAACVISAIPVGLASLALQDFILARIMRASQHDVAYARMPYRLQHTLQLLFNGALCSAADVSEQQQNKMKLDRKKMSRISVISFSLHFFFQVVGTFCIRPRTLSRPRHDSALWRWFPLLNIDSHSLCVHRLFKMCQSGCPVILSPPLQRRYPRCAVGVECEDDAVCTEMKYLDGCAGVGWLLQDLLWSTSLHLELVSFVLGVTFLCCGIIC
jgi:hypothetical protein